MYSIKNLLHERLNNRQEKVISQERKMAYWIAGLDNRTALPKVLLSSVTHMVQSKSHNSEKQTRKLLVGIKL